jgi:hypothetical protein
MPLCTFYSKIVISVTHGSAGDHDDHDRPSPTRGRKSVDHKYAMRVPSGLEHVSECLIDLTQERDKFANQNRNQKHCDDRRSLLSIGQPPKLHELRQACTSEAQCKRSPRNILTFLPIIIPCVTKMIPCSSVGMMWRVTIITAHIENV